MNIRNAIVAFLCGFLLSVTVKFVYEAVSFKTYAWNTIPNVVNCYGDDLHESYITQAVSFWKDKGEKIGTIILNPTDEVCNQKYIVNHIVIRKAAAGQLDHKTLAVTHRNTTKLQMNAASIYFKVEMFKRRWLMEHEIGHALGYSHVKQRGHVMNPVHEKMGAKFWIP